MTLISSTFFPKTSSTSSVQSTDNTGTPFTFADCLQTAVNTQGQKDDAIDAIGSEMRQMIKQRGATTEQISMVNSIFIEAENTGISPAEAKDFLRSLSKDQLEALQVAHCLADTIDIDSLSDEGAINLLLSKDNQLDVDNNGMVEIGIGITFRMPPPNASDEVKAAWDEMTEGMDEKELMIMDFYFMSEFLTTNIKTNSAGEAIGFYSPKDPEWQNPYAAASFSWQDQAQKMLDNLEASKRHMDLERYNQTKDFFTSWKATLAEYGVS
ncbi:hypothetical protein [Desulfogranum japonicum]|uniref:hypothetical protein n=1 Tax=Desulfogranum japonicum TaxID=231447 RepID=UPI00048D12D3|nr:hypothetical protein [Desulfogranum japonicum]